jgi:hypothetical protein
MSMRVQLTNKLLQPSADKMKFETLHCEYKLQIKNVDLDNLFCKKLNFYLFLYLTHLRLAYFKSKVLSENELNASVLKFVTSSYANEACLPLCF